MRGAVLAKTPSGIMEFQVVWKTKYDDGDTYQLNRIDIVAALRLYRLHREVDTRIPPTLVDSANNIVADKNDNLDDEADVPLC